MTSINARTVKNIFMADMEFIMEQLKALEEAMKYGKEKQRIQSTAIR